MAWKVIGKLQEKVFPEIFFSLFYHTPQINSSCYNRKIAWHIERSKQGATQREENKIALAFCSFGFQVSSYLKHYELSDQSSSVHFPCVRRVSFLLVRADYTQTLEEEDNSTCCIKGSPAMLQSGQQRSKPQLLCQTNRCRIYCAIYVSLISVLERFYYFSHFQDLGQLIPKNFKAS